MNSVVAHVFGTARIVGEAGPTAFARARADAKSWTARVALACALALSFGAQVAGQSVEAEPMRCWWRTSAGAVRVGELFSVVLTCSVIQTEALTVVPSQAELDPSAMQLTPFEVMGGAHGTDLITSDHRFFQYEYQARLINEETFGKDVKLPELKITYKVRSHTEGDAIEGRDQTYVLPPISVRVLSLVPADASDIRDSSLETFGSIDRRLSRANVLRVIGGVLIGFAALAALVAIARVVRSRSGSRSRTAPSLVSDASILREIGRELSDIQRARGDGQWTPGLAARVLTALRIISAYALGVTTTPLAAVPGAPGASDLSGFEGHLNVRGRGLRGAKVTLPAWVTSNVITQELQRPPGSPTLQHADALEGLKGVLGRLTSAQFGRENALDNQLLDDALAMAFAVLRTLKVENVWVMKKFRALRRSKVVDTANRAWSR